MNEYMNTDEQINIKQKALPEMNESIYKNKKTYKRLTKDHVVHQLKEIFFKIIFCSGMLASVEVDVVFQLWRLIERQNTIDVGETLSQFQVQL